MAWWRTLPPPDFLLSGESDGPARIRVHRPVGAGGGGVLAGSRPQRQHAGSRTGTKAIVVYPMNALANSQEQALRGFLGAADPLVTFAALRPDAAALRCGSAGGCGQPRPSGHRPEGPKHGDDQPYSRLIAACSNALGCLRAGFVLTGGCLS